MIYHITLTSEWERAQSNGVYIPENYSADGFVHCSTKEQILDTAKRYYDGRQGLFLLEIDEARLTAEVVFENLIGGQEMFPHLYGPLNLDAVSAVADLTQDSSGNFRFPSNWKRLKPKA